MNEKFEYPSEFPFPGVHRNLIQEAKNAGIPDLDIAKHIETSIQIADKDFSNNRIDLSTLLYFDITDGILGFNYRGNDKKINLQIVQLYRMLEDRFNLIKNNEDSLKIHELKKNVEDIIPTISSMKNFYINQTK